MENVIEDDRAVAGTEAGPERPDGRRTRWAEHRRRRREELVTAALRAITRTGAGLGMDDLAAAAGTTGRALQDAFRRNYDTTPVGHLRTVRLERAYTELQNADATTGVTVDAVARRWGWTSPGQFAVAYQRRFGEPPSRTLRT